MYLYIYIEKKNATLCVLLCSFAKERNVLAFFYILAKERNIFCVLLRSLQKNVAFSVFFYVLKKRMQKNASFFWVS